MNDLRLNELVNAAVDGELDPAGQEELQQLLESSDSARSLYEEVQGLVNFIEQTPSIEPPPELRRRILDGIPLPAQKRPWLGFFDVWVNFGQAVPRAAQLGLAFATGTALTIGAYTLSGSMNGAVPTDQLVGTMARESTSTPPRFIDRVQIAARTVKGQATLKLVDGDWVLGFDLEPTAPVQIDVWVGGNEGKRLQFAIAEQSRIWTQVKAGSLQTPPALAFTIVEDGGDGQPVFSGSFDAPQ